MILRFTAHPWGAKYLALPLLALAAAGLFFRRLPYLATFAAAHIGVCLLFASRFEGVQPVIPALLPIAIYAAAALPPRISVAVALVYAAASFAYVSPVLTARRSNASPTSAALRECACEPSARISSQQMPGRGPGTTLSMLLVDPVFEPFADYFELNAQPIKAFGEYARTEEELYLMVQGRSESPDARVFEWPASDAYTKLTSGQYRVVSLVPVPAARRYIPRLGVYAFESAPERGGWQWLARDAAIDLPARGPTTVRLALPPDAPMVSIDVRVNDVPIRVTRGAPTGVDVPEADRLIFSSSTSYRDGEGRDLAVQLISIVRR